MIDLVFLILRDPDMLDKGLPPIPDSNHSISMPTAPPDSAFPTPAPEIGLGDLDIMDQWLTFMEDPPDLGDKFDMEDEDAGCHFDNLLEEMEGDEPWDKDLESLD